VVKKRKGFRMVDVGPSTEETQEILHRMYVEQYKYRGGKTLRQLVDEANDPSRWRGRD